MRVPVYMDHDDAKINALCTELHTLQTLQEKGFPWAPRCRGSSLSFNNAVRHPFMLLTWVNGVTLPWDETVPARAVRDKVLTQMAAIQLALIEYTYKDGTYLSISLFTSLFLRSVEAYQVYVLGIVTAAKYLERVAANRLTRVVEAQIPGLSEQDCTDQHALIAAVLGPDTDDTALAMDHGDFKLDNIVVDDEYNIKGYVAHGGIERCLLAPQISYKLIPIG